MRRVLRQEFRGQADPFGRGSDDPTFPSEAAPEAAAAAYFPTTVGHQRSTNQRSKARCPPSQDVPDRARTGVDKQRQLGLVPDIGQA